jgi:hypothetical protein
MFNNLLKGRIDALCMELSGLVANEPTLIACGSSQSQSQGSQQATSGPAGPVSLFVQPKPAAAPAIGGRRISVGPAAPARKTVSAMRISTRLGD